MKERPILFSAPMVLAILDGRKTQTRRIVKQWPQTLPGWWKAMHWASAGHFIKGAPQHCPYGQVSDRLWVRETWRIGAWNEEEGQIAVDYKAGPVAKSPWIDVPDDGTRSMETFEYYWIQCSDDCANAGVKTDADGKYHWQAGESPCRWRPSIHMPRWASRINLEITNVRVERLKDISGDDAEAEGVCLVTKAERICRAGDSPLDAAIFIDQYRMLWESINGKGSWDANPWVWVIEFRKLT